MSAPWQCPACLVWLAPGVATHRCDDATAQLRLATVADATSDDEVARKILGSEDLQTPSPKKRSASANTTPDQGYPPAFMVFWQEYPLHRDKLKALKAWRNAIRKVSQDAIVAGATRYRNDPNREDAFTKYAATWLNAGGWEDEPLPARSNGQRPDPPRPMTSGEMDQYIEEQLGGRRDD